MSNQFDAVNYPTTEPVSLVVGDRWAWKNTTLGVDYAPASYTLKYSLRLEGAGNEVEITATTSGTDYLIEVAAATTATYLPGRYQWQAYITRNSDSERITVDSGAMELLANRDVSTTDPRGHAKRMVDAIEAAVEALNHGVSSYSISTGSGTRTVTYRNIPELVALRDRYLQEVQEERVKERIANGLGDPRRVGVRFNRV